MNQLDSQSERFPTESDLRVAFQQITAGEARIVEMFQPTSSGATDHHKVVLPGSFNPLHAGHTRMAETASRLIGQPVWFELAIRNADKPSLDFDQLWNRLRPALCGPDVSTSSGEKSGESFGRHGLILTSAATYVQKAQLFPGCHFAIGADTIVRVADPKFYSDSTDLRDAAIAELSELGCRFVVFGRTQSHDNTTPFVELNDLNLPASLRQICDTVPESKFRSDVSSTELRNRSDEAG